MFQKEGSTAFQKFSFYAKALPLKIKNVWMILYKYQKSLAFDIQLFTIHKNLYGTPSKTQALYACFLESGQSMWFWLWGEI